MAAAEEKISNGESEECRVESFSPSLWLLRYFLSLTPFFGCFGNSSIAIFMGFASPAHTTQLQARNEHDRQAFTY
jgi:hypothetical protein